MSDIEHQGELTSTSNQQERLPDAIEPDPPLSDHEDLIYQATQLELGLEFN